MGSGCTPERTFRRGVAPTNQPPTSRLARAPVLQDDELGELEDDEQAAQARGTADIHQFDAVLDEFLQEERRQVRWACGAGRGGALSGRACWVAWRCLC